MKVALVKTSDWDDIKDEYRGFDVDEVHYDQTELYFQKRWPEGYVQRFHSELRSHELIIEEV